MQVHVPSEGKFASPSEGTSDVREEQPEGIPKGSKYTHG